MALSNLTNLQRPQDQVLDQTQKSIDSALARFQSQGITPPEPQETKPSFLQRAFSLLNVANPAPYVMAGMKGASLGGVMQRQAKRAWQSGIKGEQWKPATPREQKIDLAVFSDVLDDMGWTTKDTPNKTLI